MATDTLVPNSDDSGWDTGSFADVDEGVLTPDDDATKVVETSRNTTMLFGLTSTVVVDADTVTNISVDVRARSDKASSNSNLGIEILIGGVVQGAQQTVTLTTSWASTFGTNDAAWNVDRTAAQLNGMEVQIESVQGGMPTADVWEVSAIDVVITFTEAAAGGIVTSLVGAGGLVNAGGLLGPGGGLVG